MKNPRRFRLHTALAIAWCGATSAFGVITVTTSAGPGEPRFFTSNGTTAVPDGMTYTLGTFAPGADLSQAGSAPGTLFTTSWQPFASDTVTTNTFTGDPGTAGADLDGPDVFSMSRIYWWVFVTGDGLAPAPDFSNVTEHALFTGPASWTFPSPGMGVPPIVSTADPLTFSAGSLASGNIVLSPVTPIPEPSVVPLVLTAVTLTRRRRSVIAR